MEFHSIEYNVLHKHLLKCIKIKKSVFFANCYDPCMLQLGLFNNVVAIFRILCPKQYTYNTTLQQCEHMAAQLCNFGSCNVAATFDSQCCKTTMFYKVVLRFVFSGYKIPT